MLIRASWEGKSMKRRILVAAAAVATGAGLFLVGPGGHATKHAASDPCVVINGGNGLTVQVGYAPNGPGGCTQL